MKTFLIGIGLSLALAVSAQAQVAPSSYTPLSNCAFLDTRSSAPYAANSTHFFKVRGSCNVPATANAVALTIVAVDPNADGRARVLESSLPNDTAQSVLYWKGGTGNTSGTPIVRLCYPVDECSTEDLQLWTSAQAHFLIRVAGYFEPLP
jgi:hypothetical protein